MLEQSIDSGQVLHTQSALTCVTLVPGGVQHAAAIKLAPVADPLPLPLAGTSAWPHCCSIEALPTVQHGAWLFG